MLSDANGNKLYISLDDLQSSNWSFVFDSSTPPSNVLTQLFQVDGNGNLLVSADDPNNHLPLIFMICPGDLFIRVGTGSNTCSTVKIGQTYTPVSSTPASSAPPVSTPASSNIPSTASSGPSSAVSSSPASSGAPAVTGTIEFVTIPDNQTINQFTYELDISSFGEIDTTVYDQNHDPIPNVALDLSCSEGTTCYFVNSSLQLITTAITDDNGTFSFYLVSLQRGAKQVLVSAPSLNASNTTDWVVLPVVNCANSTFTAVALRNGTENDNVNVTDLIMNSDSVMFESHIVDFFGDPMENQTTTITVQEPTRKVKRGLGNGYTIYSDADGNANYTSTEQGIYPVTWTGQFETCSDTNSFTVQYHYDPDCTNSVVTPASGYSLPIESPLVISANYAQNIGGLEGATINVYWLGGNTQMSLDDNGAASTTIDYIAGTAVNQTYTLDFVGANPSCEQTINVFWLRSCDATHSTMTFNSATLNTAQQLVVTVTVEDSQGYALEGFQVTISGTLHFPTSGVTDVNGMFVWIAPAPSSSGPEIFTATIQGGCILTSSMTWTMDI